LKVVPLTAIYVEDYSGSDLAFAISFPQLRELTLTCENVTRGMVEDLSPLVQCPLLKRLAITNESISDVSPLMNLEYLSELDLSDNLISDIDSLSSFRHSIWSVLLPTIS
jgi:Leucine-rich repeat (LRR) protein